MTSMKPHRIRVRTKDGQPREPNKLKGKLFPHVDVWDAGRKVEFIICAAVEKHLADVRAKLDGAGLEEIPGGSTELLSTPIPPRITRTEHTVQERPRRESRGHSQQRQAQSAHDLLKKPYAFVSLPEKFTVSDPVWHDGSGGTGRLSGEVRFELTTLTPMLVGWERQKIGEEAPENPWRIPFEVLQSTRELDDFVAKATRQAHPDAADPKKQQRVEQSRREYESNIRNNVANVPRCGVGWVVAGKALLCPLRAPWGDRPVLIPGDSLKGLLRHELGALLGAPMERVAERSYSYRPNSLYADPGSRGIKLVARIGRIPASGIDMRSLDANQPGAPRVRVPTKLELLPLNLQYDRKHEREAPRYRFDPSSGGAAYRGGQGAGERLNSKKRLHNRLEVNPDGPSESVTLTDEVIEGYLHTIRHVTDSTAGHFSERHPDVPNNARERILHAASNVVFQPGDLIWVEWDIKEKRVASFGWHYYYRWTYEDTVRTRAWTSDRYGLFPLPEELGDTPTKLSAVRRLFGYTGDNDGSKGIGVGDHSQLMGRVSVNAAIEVVPSGCSETDRFLRPTFLKELGMPRPSAVEHYLKQPYWPRARPSDQAALVTYGDAAGYDTPGELAGRKFYLDRKDAYPSAPWEDASESNRLNDRSTIAVDASRPGRQFRFTLRFRDLDPGELAAILLAFCPHQFGKAVGGVNADGYCSKLGYARPLGWGTVRIEAKELHFLDEETDIPSLESLNVGVWLQEHHDQIHAPLLTRWLDVHRHKHPDAADYPRENGEIFTFHTKLRAEHSRARRYSPESAE
jgi:CRISPR-associated protein (TIGR03986 family)